MLVRYMKGYYKIRIDKSDISRAVSLLYKNNIHAPLKKEKREQIVFICDKKSYGSLKQLFENEKIEIISDKLCGFPSVVGRYKKRPGVYAGVFMLLFSLLVSRMFIWEINIKGNDTVSREETLSLLREHGIYVGAFSPALNLREIYNRILIDNDDFCWISVNLRGTVANVEVRETEDPKKMTPDKNKYANIVAEYDGQITLVEAYEGQSYVKYGDYVRAGELLVSGIYEDKLGKTVAKYAHGKIYAVTEKEFYIEIPLEYDKKVYTGAEETSFSIKFFSKNINILNNSGKTDTKYDIIEENEEVCLFDSIRLPVSYTRKIYKEYSAETATRDESQARRMAYERLNREITMFTGDGELLSKEAYEELSDGVFKLRIKASVNKDIAKIQEFKYTEG